jgi:hypothetical protein
LNKNTLLPFPVPNNRDVRLFQFTNGTVMVIGCDSSGGIGPKPLDKLKVDAYTLGKFTARVALMEVLSTGANPVCVVDNLSVEFNPTGKEILRGVREEAVKAGLDPKLAVTGSCEKNFAVEQSGIGVTVIGFCEKSKLRIGVSHSGDALVALGCPSMGSEVVPAENNGVICNVVDVLELLKLAFVHEIIPVGSEGIKREINVLAEGSNLKFKPESTCRVDFEKSAGPATAILISLEASKLDVFERLFNKPISYIGTLL